MIFSMLFQWSNLPLNESLYVKQLSYHAKQSILNIIDEQRKTISRMDRELSHRGKPLGTVQLIKIIPDNETDTHYGLIYSRHQTLTDYTVVWTYPTYDCKYIFNQIRDYINDYEPSCCEKVKDIALTVNLVMLIKINNMTATLNLFNDIIKNKAEILPLAKNKVHKWQLIEVSDYDKTIAKEIGAIPFRLTTNYYLRQFGYKNDDYNSYISIIDITHKRLILTLDTITPSNDANVRSEICDKLIGFINDLENWQAFDSDFTYEIICKKDRYARRVREILDEMPNLQQPINISIMRRYSISN